MKIKLTEEIIKNYSIYCSSALEKELAIQLFRSFGYKLPLGADIEWIEGRTWEYSPYVYTNHYEVLGNSECFNNHINFSDIENFKNKIKLKVPKWKKYWNE